MAKPAPKRVKKVTLIASDEKSPKMPLKIGQRFEVVAVKLAGPEIAKGKPIGARLCGGSGTCLAIIDIEPGEK